MHVSIVCGWVRLSLASRYESGEETGGHALRCGSSNSDFACGFLDIPRMVDEMSGTKEEESWKTLLDVVYVDAGNGGG